MGETLFNVFRPQEDDGAYRESICGTWHMLIGTLLIFSLFANNVPNGWSDRNERDTNRFVDLGKMTVPLENRSVALGTCRLQLAQY